MSKDYARDVYGRTLIELGKKDKRVVVLDADLSGSTRTSLFAAEFPDRFFNLGIAEQNMIATAAGLAASSKIVFASTFAMFATARVLDQIRNSVCYNNLNVKIVATHAGITVGEDGVSHQALEDIAILRAIPNMQIIVPSDSEEAKSAVIAAYENDGPFYIRLGRAKVNTIEDKKDFIFKKGYALKDGKDIAIVACGVMVEQALLAADILQSKGISAAVINIHTIKPIDKELIVSIAGKCPKMVVCEEHQVMGGLYSSVCEILANECPIFVEPLGINDEFGRSGTPDSLLEFYGLTADGIVNKCEKILSK